MVECMDEVYIKKDRCWEHVGEAEKINLKGICTLVNY